MGKTEELLGKWARANKGLVQARVELSNAEMEQIKASAELGKWLMPDGQAKAIMTDGKSEWFNIWIGSGILRARFIESRNWYEVEWLKYPDEKAAILLPN